MTRFRDLGFTVGEYSPGEANSITDVPGVRVGHQTRVDGDRVRTGVSAIWPHGRDPFVYKTPCAAHVINGFGKAIGLPQVDELGVIETPILLCGTLSIWRVADALARWTLDRHPGLRSVNPVVGETNDGFLHDALQPIITADDVIAALDGAATGTIAEGNIGAGTGTTCYQFKGGVGTASRRILHTDYTLGVLVQTNFGQRRDLRVLGVPVGMAVPDLLPENPTPPGSIMVVVATSAPLTSRQLARLARRATLGIARTGTIGAGGSGDFVLAFSNAHPRAHSRYQTSQPNAMILDDSPLMSVLFRAVVESTEEAIYNALVAAETMRGRDGHTLHALPHDRLVALLSG